LAEDLLMAVRIVDTKEKLEVFLGEIDEQLPAGLVTLEKAQIRFYKAEKK
jgi:PII-like signaling protein